jgi:hypothetical protein
MTTDRDHDVRYFLGLPYRWDAKRAFVGLWDKDDQRLFPPKRFGVGWSINFYAVGKKLGLVK